jgi:hypothetical protein
MLWALAVAAALGALSMVLFPYEVAGRIVGPALVMAAAAGLLIPMDMLAGRPAQRWAGFLGMGFVLAQSLLGLILIWDIPRLLGNPYDERLFLTMLWLFCCVPPAMVCLLCVGLPSGRVAAWTGTGIAGLVFLLLMLGTWIRGGAGVFYRGWDLEESAGVIAGFGFLATLSLIGAGTDRRHWRFAGVLASVLGAAIAVYAIVRALHSDSGILVHLIAVAAVIAHANLCESLPLHGVQRWVGRGTIVMAAITAMLLDVMAVYQVDLGGDWMARLAGATGILASCGTLAMAVMAAINRKIERPAIVFQSVQNFTVICPLCGLKQTLPAGQASCAKCRLVIRTQFEEPRCPKCDYSLIMLTSGQCPECGTPV